jgi:hypothetical protein
MSTNEKRFMYAPTSATPEERLATLEAAPRLALRYVARAAAWSQGAARWESITLGAFETDDAAHAALSKPPPNGWSDIHHPTVEPEIVVIVGDVVQVVTLGEVIAGGSK